MHCDYVSSTKYARLETSIVSALQSVVPLKRARSELTSERTIWHDVALQNQDASSQFVFGVEPKFSTVSIEKLLIKLKMIILNSIWYAVLLVTAANANTHTHHDQSISCQHPAYRSHLISKSPLVIYLDGFLTSDEQTHLQTIT